MERLRATVESKKFQNGIIVVIILNAIVLGLETSNTVMASAGGLLRVLDTIALTIFVIEITMKLVVYRLEFFHRPWSVFDFAVVTITLLPTGEGVSVLRALRILRALRLVSVVPSMRLVVQALARAIPGMGSIIALLLLVFYIASVIATKLFGESHPQWFGTLGESFYSLFQIMTLESWSMGIVRPVMEVHPFAWVFFVVFILLTTFAVLNLFIAIIVDSMTQEHRAQEEETRSELTSTLGSEHHEIMAELRALRSEVRSLKSERAGSD